MATRLLFTLLAKGKGVTSIQVVSELSNVILGKRCDLADAGRARTLAAAILQDWPTAFLTVDTIDTTFEGVERFGFSWYDAQIWAAAKLAGCNVVLSEDFCDGMLADGVRFVNPFAPHFDVDGFTKRLSA